MAEKEERYTEEQKEILHKGFQEHDFTQNVSLSPGCEFSGKDAEMYSSRMAAYHRFTRSRLIDTFRSSVNATK